uniref:Uncharacterized protein n=1 Tax=Xiphophorus couchianus TaxID=32473 RepID=A0A3B5MC50_9TELE
MRMSWAQMDSDPHHTAKYDANMKNKKVAYEQPANLAQFHQFSQEKWTKIPANCGANLEQLR